MPSKNTKDDDRLGTLLSGAGLKPKEQVMPQTTAADTKQARVPVYNNELANGDVVQESKTMGRPTKPDDEKATEKVTAYFTAEQYDKIEDLRRSHRKRTGKRISVNELLRRLVIHATIEDILKDQS